MKTEFRIRRIMQWVTLVLALLLIGLLVKEYWGKQQREEYYLEKSVEAVDLRARKRELQQQRMQLEREYQVKINGKGTLTLLFTGMTEEVYTVMYPLLQEYGFCGVLAISDMEKLGTRGGLTMEQFSELLEKGWTCSLHWTGEGDLETWLAGMKAALQEKGFTMPGTIYFDWGDYQMEYDNLLADYGLEAVVHHQEDGLPGLTSNTGEGIWHICAWGWNQVNARNTLEDAVESGAGMVFSVGEDFYYDEDQFPKMLAILAGYEEEEALYVTDVSAAYAYRSETEEERESLQAQLKEETDRLDKEISQLDAQIGKIYYGEEGSAQ